MKNIVIGLMLAVSFSVNANVLTGILNTKMCKQSLLNVLGLDSQENGTIKRVLEGKDLNGENCSFELTLQTAENSGSLSIYVLNSGTFPFNHYVYLTDKCEASTTEASGRNTIRSKYGWHRKYKAVARLVRLEADQLRIEYRQEDSKALTCTGSLK